MGCGVCRVSLAPNTVRGYKVNFNNHTISYIGHIPVQQLTPVQVQDLYSQLEKKGLSARSIWYVHTTLRKALQYAYQAQHIAKNVADIDKEYIFGDTKTKSGQRSLLLSEPLMERLQRHKRDQNKVRLLPGSDYQNHNLICCKKDGSPYHTGTFLHKSKTFLEKNKLPKTRLHDLRHTNATLLLQYGVPAKIASQRLGHANIAITLDTYSHVSVEMQEDAVSKLASGVFGKLDEHVG